MLRFCVPGATYGCRASIVPLYKDAVIVEHSAACVLQEYAFFKNLDGECINDRKTVGVGAISGDGGPSGVYLESVLRWRATPDFDWVHFWAEFVLGWHLPYELASACLTVWNSPVLPR